MNDPTCRLIAKTLGETDLNNGIDAGLRDYARRQGVSILYHPADDVMEFNGAVDGDVDCDGDVCAVQVDHKGILVDDVSLSPGETVESLLKRFMTASFIRVVRRQEGGGWDYVTELPHEYFTVRRGGDVAGRGIVFRIP